MKLSDNPIFLLGGRDLEMIEIKKILDSKGACYVDRDLSWGAKLSDYRDILNDEQMFYGIELILDISPPKNYTVIDHHNQLQSRDSSIEQIAKIFDIELDRFRELVAINDKAYIDGMRSFGATDDEIEHIRMLDRQAQGVTPDDEIIAQAIISKLDLKDEIIVIDTTLERFSPIIDRLYGKNILITNRYNLNYYGKGVKKLVREFKDMIENKEAYYGGGYGFFGISIKSSDIGKYKKRVLEIV